jgi:enoyl-CoA hydratase/carnithine racemase
MSIPVASDTVQVTFDSQSRVLTLRFVARHQANLVTPRVVEELGAAVAGIADRYPGTRTLVLRGRDDVFCGGAEVQELLELDKPGRLQMLTGEHELLRRIEQLPCPTVAALTGPCFGFGLHLALACDFRIARSDTRIALPETRVGISATVQRLSRFVGIGRAKEMLLLGRQLDAEKALQWGLLTEVAGADEFEDRVARLVRASAATAPLAIAAVKASIEADYPWSVSRHAAELAGALDALDTDDYREGTEAIRQSRRPSFTGH